MNGRPLGKAAVRPTARTSRPATALAPKGEKPMKTVMRHGCVLQVTAVRIVKAMQDIAFASRR